jgi:hypothetical protein
MKAFKNTGIYGTGGREHNILLQAQRALPMPYSSLMADAIKVGRTPLTVLPFENGSALNVVGLINVADLRRR